MTDREAKDWEQWQLRGQLMFRVMQAYLCFGRCVFIGLGISLLLTRRAEILPLLGISAAMSFIWFFFAIGLWHKNEYAYMRHADSGKSLSPGRHRAALRSLAGSSASMSVLFVALATTFVASHASWYFLPGLAGVYLLLLVLEYLKGLRQSHPGA